ncbi:MAG: SAM-dependent methyltransferase [Acidobacteriia bacterium]|nr:SAM-dependent methyltransferase [Terriglobia bacterium]
MVRPAPKDELNWLSGDPRLHELMERYPILWEDAGRELVAALEDGCAQTLSDLASAARSTAEFWKGRIRRSRNNLRVIESALPYLVRSRMTLLALDKCFLAAATGKASGKVRFNLINGYIIQKLLFSDHLTRKPASLGWFRFWWRIVGQKRLLMPLVQPKGIYCFYSRKLIEELARLLGTRMCLEIGAGDGTLSRFLAAKGVRIAATDDHSWKHAVEYSEAVERLDARQALDKYEPQTVICSWPPPANSFERHVFATKSVELYVVIGSRYRFASGNWEAYSNQSRFEWNHDPTLAGYVLPPELESAILIFRRKPAQEAP